MADSRRKTLYIDRIFQNKFLLLFLALSVLATLGNVLYLFVFLKRDLEHQLYRARIVIANVNDIVTHNTVYFNIILLFAILALAIVVYVLIRKRIQFFVDRLKQALAMRKNNRPVEGPAYSLPQEFQNIDEELGKFFYAVDTRQEAEREVIAAIKQFLDSPDDAGREKIRETMNRLWTRIRLMFNNGDK